MIWHLHNYNGWDVPFAKTVELNATESNEFPTANYVMKVDPNAYFSIVFVSGDHFDMRDKDLRTLNYTFFGSANYNFTGIWLTMDMLFNKDVISVQASATTADYAVVGIEVFVAFGACPIEGIEGTIGIVSLGNIFTEYSVIAKIQANDPTFPSDFMEFYFN